MALLPTPIHIYIYNQGMLVLTPVSTTISYNIHIQLSVVVRQEEIIHEICIRYGDDAKTSSAIDRVTRGASGGYQGEVVEYAERAGKKIIIPLLRDRNVYYYITTPTSTTTRAKHFVFLCIIHRLILWNIARNPYRPSFLVGQRIK